MANDSGRLRSAVSAVPVSVPNAWEPPDVLYGEHRQGYAARCQRSYDAWDALRSRLKEGRKDGPMQNEIVSQEEFDKAFRDLMGLPAEIAAVSRRLRELEDRHRRAQQIVDKVRGK